VFAFCSEGGYFPCLLEFPKEYPNKPPVMTFTTKGFWHPNVYKDGKVCISILHEAKADEFNQQEKMSEKCSSTTRAGAQRASSVRQHHRAVSTEAAHPYEQQSMFAR
jgi:hypothetical protein